MTIMKSTVSRKSALFRLLLAVCLLLLALPALADEPCFVSLLPAPEAGACRAELFFADSEVVAAEVEAALSTSIAAQGRPAALSKAN